MNQLVHLIGAGRTDFKRNLKKEGRGLRDVIVEAGRAAIADAGIDPADIQAGVVGNFAAGLFTRQLHLGALLTEIDPLLRGLPTWHVEAACASGGVAVLNGAQQILGGLHDVVLVVGVEQQKTMSPAEGADVLGGAGDYAGERAQFGEFMFPKLFGRVAQLYAQRYALTDKQLALAAFKNHAHARLNPLAQMRDSTLPLNSFCTVSEANPQIAAPLKLSDCSQITDGAAAVVLCSGRFAEKLGRRSRVQLLGYGHATDHVALARKDVPELAIPRRAAVRAYEMAELKPGDIHSAEVHDCFSISEILAYEILGFAGPGQGPALLESGATALPAVREQFDIPHSAPRIRDLPVNTSGGLMGDGHPVGATGVRQVVTAYQQLAGTAGAFQVPGAKRVLTFNMGGSFTTSVVMIWGGEG